MLFQLYRKGVYRENVIEIFKIRMIKYLKEDSLTKNEKLIVDSIRSWTSSELSTILYQSFGEQSEVIDKRTRLLRELFHRELNELWLPTFSKEVYNMQEVESLNPSLAKSIKETDMKYSIVLKSFCVWLSQNKWFEDASQARKQKAVNELELYIKLFKSYFSYVETMYNCIEHKTRCKWDETLTKFDKDMTVEHFNLIVSLGKADWFKKHNKTVSASYITEKNTAMYTADGQKMGWCFDIGQNDVIGMCPYDFNSGILENLELCYNELYKAALAGAEFTEQLQVFRTAYPDVLRWYKPSDLIERTKPDACNEILFNAVNIQPVPTAVFVISDYTVDNALFEDENCKRASTVANIYGLPLVIYSTLDKLVRIKAKPEIVI